MWVKECGPGRSAALRSVKNKRQEVQPPAHDATFKVDYALAVLRTRRWG